MRKFPFGIHDKSNYVKAMPLTFPRNLSSIPTRKYHLLSPFTFYVYWVKLGCYTPLKSWIELLKHSYIVNKTLSKILMGFQQEVYSYTTLLVFSIQHSLIIYVGFQGLLLHNNSFYKHTTLRLMNVCPICFTTVYIALTYNFCKNIYYGQRRKSILRSIPVHEKQDMARC